MPYFVHDQHQQTPLEGVKYGFFTNERGHSTDGYLAAGEPTRNVNLFSPQDSTKAGYDPADRVIKNIQECFAELVRANPECQHHKIMMTTHYAKDGLRVLTIPDAQNLATLKTQAQTGLASLGLELPMQQAIEHSDITVVKADAVVFKKIAGEIIAVGGVSGDAHPIVLFDQVTGVCAYVAGAHAGLKAGVLASVVAEMVALGADQANINLVIGPGLGPDSYEFGHNAPAYFNLAADDIEKVLAPIKNETGDVVKYLINIENLVKHLTKDCLIEANIFNINIDNIGAPLYVNRIKQDIDFAKLKETGYLFFSARRTVKAEQGIDAENAALHSTEGRHGAFISI